MTAEKYEIHDCGNVPMGIQVAQILDTQWYLKENNEGIVVTGTILYCPYCGKKLVLDGARLT